MDSDSPQAFKCVFLISQLGFVFLDKVVGIFFFFFCKRPGSKYFRLWRPYSLCCTPHPCWCSVQTATENVHTHAHGWIPLQLGCSLWPVVQWLLPSVLLWITEIFDWSEYTILTFFLIIYPVIRLPRQRSGKESACHMRDLGFDPWIWKFPWSRKWQPPGRRRNQAGYSPWGHKATELASS